MPDTARMDAVPETMRALKVTGIGKLAIRNVPLPTLRRDYVLIKVHTAALNPTDWKHVYTPAVARESIGCTVGCDYMGHIVQVGSKVTKDFKPGDRVAGFTHGVNSVEKEDGCFAEYCVAKGDVQMKVPDTLHDEEASTLGTDITTVGQGLYQSLRIPLPGSAQAGYPILIYGGSTATGSLAIQFAGLSGCQVITTCSPRNFNFVKALGVAEAFDYNDPDCAKKIREYTKDQLTRVFDCVSEGESPRISSEAISSQGGEVSYLLPTKHDRTDVSNKCTLAYTLTGETFELVGGTEIHARPADFDFAKQFWNLATKLIAQGEIIPHPVKKSKGGLDGLAGGIAQLKKDSASAFKWVFNI